MKKEQRGITLIALVITIIILLILAGVTLKIVFDEGLIGKSEQAVDDYAKAQENEIKDLNKVEQEMDRILGNLPENTPENPQDIGKEVALKDSWGTETVSYIKTSDGVEVTNVTKVATVYAVSVGNGETVPVPKGFYYVGGNFNTGVIISDNPDDKYDGKTDKTTYAYTTSLKGNQFVWIPCTTNEYKKTDWGKQNAEWDTTIPKAELSQIEKYGGFYVARYEAGLASTITEFTTTEKHPSTIYNLDGIPQSKAGIIPWMFIDWTHAKANAEKMYNNNYVSSGLITGTQWDVILNTLINKTDLESSDITNSSAWGNYADNSISYAGRLAKVDYSVTGWTVSQFGAKTTGTTTICSNKSGEIITTGASSVTEKYHVFDLAGNLSEWTEEDSHKATSGQYRVLRGGNLHIISSETNCASYRNGGNDVEYTEFSIGYRPVLYIK